MELNQRILIRGYRRLENSLITSVKMLKLILVQLTSKENHIPLDPSLLNLPMILFQYICWCSRTFSCSRKSTVGMLKKWLRKDETNDQTSKKIHGSIWDFKILLNSVLKVV